MSKQWRSITVLAFVMTVSRCLSGGDLGAQTLQGRRSCVDLVVRRSWRQRRRPTGSTAWDRPQDWREPHAPSRPRVDGPSSRANGSPSRPGTGRPRMTRRW